MTVLIACAIAHADVVQIPVAPAAPVAQSPQGGADNELWRTPAYQRDLDNLNWLLTGSADGLPSPAAPTATRDSAFPVVKERMVSELPAPPSSLGLGLSALALLGAFQAGRSFKKLHIGALPEWYATNGPTQIGHATACDLEFGGMPACVFDEPGDAAKVVVQRIPREPRSRCRFETFLWDLAPRGPPIS